MWNWRRRLQTGLQVGLGSLVLLALLAACSGSANPSGEKGATSAAPSSETSAFALPPGLDVEGHRGARGLKPENTLPAFETALDLGVTTLELDLHYSADDQLVIWHDDRVVPEKCRLDPQAAPPLPPDPDGKTPPEQLMIRKLTVEQLAKYRCDRNPDPKKFPEQDNGPTALAGDTYRIITLGELFDFVEGYASSPEKSPAQQEQARKVQFNVETKRKRDRPDVIGDGFDGENPGPFEQALVALVTERGLTERVIVQSFDHRSLWAIRKIAPELRLAALTSRSADPPSYAEKGAVIWSPRYTTLTPRLVNEAHDAGLLVIPWTVNDLAEVQQLIDMGVDGIITDRPDLLLGARAE